MLRFLKYSLLGMLFANVPFVGYGLIMGWPAVILSALILTIFHTKLVSLSRFTLFFATVAICLISATLNGLLWFTFIGATTPEQMKFLGTFVMLASIPILLVSFIVAFFHSKKLVEVLK